MSKEKESQKQKEELRKRLKEDCGRIMIGSSQKGCKMGCCDFKIK
ncbi:hypothetical protein [Halanaerobium hydrogeniformans]|uniref:ATP/GTP binding protein n=1 Tax=Halanaerobium hydrogeniformans TaxID=656519 RepID=E4RM25_HALHG|nr:hypothetical protein [Halanaerobium hydrogeniformans]ADQ14108.1 ATP/GTP binding protein [Halanaerobium hydrogeniformans]